MRSTVSPLLKEAGLLRSPLGYLQTHSSDPVEALPPRPTLLPSPGHAQDNSPATERLSFAPDPATWQVAPQNDVEGGAAHGQACPPEAGRYAARRGVTTLSQPGPPLIGRSLSLGALPRHRTRSFSAIETFLDDVQPMLDAGLISVQASSPEGLFDSGAPAAYAEGDRGGGVRGGAGTGEPRGDPVGEADGLLLPYDGRRAAGILGTQGTLLESDTSGGPPGCGSVGDPVPVGAEGPGGDEKNDGGRTEAEEGGWFQALARKLAANADIDEVCPSE